MRECSNRQIYSRLSNSNFSYQQLKGKGGKQSGEDDLI